MSILVIPSQTSNDELDAVSKLELLGRPNDPGVRGRVTGGEDGQGARRANRSQIAVDEEGLRPVGLGALCCFWPVDGDDQRDAVSLGYGLAQTSRAGHAAQWYLREVSVP